MDSYKNMIIDSLTLTNIACGICKKLMYGLIHEDVWGNKTCAIHGSQYQRCSACQRLLAKEITGGSISFDDGRLLCTLCSKSMVMTKAEAKPWVEIAAHWMYKHGFRFTGLDLRIDLVGADIYSRSPSARLAEGTMYGEIRRVTLGQSQRYVEGVTVLYGLPRVLMQGVFVHELAHAWLFLEHIDYLSVGIEEGFCNALMYSFLKSVDSPESLGFMKILDLNPDPVYGEGFRIVKNAILTHGANKVIHTIRSTRALP